MSKRSFFMGTFILAAAGIISRFAGFFYRIFLSNTLGAEGMGSEITRYALFAGIG